jgi:hypothetical protein
VRFHCGVGRESVELADSIWLALGTSAVHAESEEAVFAPLSTPRVTHDPEFFTEFFLLSFGSFAVSNHSDTVIHAVFLRTALKSFLSHHSALVELKLAISIDTDSNRLFHKNRLESIIRHALLLLHPYILKHSLLLLILTLFLIRLHPIWISLIVHKTMC